MRREHALMVLLCRICYHATRCDLNDNEIARTNIIIIEDDLQAITSVWNIIQTIRYFIAQLQIILF